MKRRSFLRKSAVTAALAASPLAMSGLVNAAGGGGSGSGNTTTWIEPTDWTETTIANTGCDSIKAWSKQGEGTPETGAVYECWWDPAEATCSDNWRCGIDPNTGNKYVYASCSSGGIAVCIRPDGTEPDANSSADYVDPDIEE